jgi:hypothetical protein
MKLILFFTLLGITLNSWGQTSYVAPTKILGKSAYQIGISGDYFKTSKGIDSTGNDVELKDSESFSRLQGEVQALYGLTDNFQIGVLARFRQNASTALNQSSEEEIDTSTGLQSVGASFVFAFRPMKRISYTLDGSFRYAPYTSEESTLTEQGKLVLGDQGSEYAIGAGVTYSSLSKNYLTGRAGFRSPGKDLSPEIYWQLEGALAWDYFALVAGVDGVTSLKGDPHEDDPGNRPMFNTGTSFLYNSINREWIAPYAGVNVGLGEFWRVELRGAQVVSGRSTDLGTAFGVSLIRRVDNKNKSRIDKSFKTYDFEAHVTKVSPKKGYLVIDKGITDDVQKGMKIDFFAFDYVGGNILLARGTVIQTKTDSAVVKITQRYNTKNELKEGVIARGSFR